MPSQSGIVYQSAARGRGWYPPELKPISGNPTRRFREEIAAGRLLHKRYTWASIKRLQPDTSCEW